MSSQISILYTDQFQPFYQSVSTLELYIWLELDGQIIFGSKDAPYPIVMPQTGNTTQDIMDGIKLALDSITGDAGDVTYTPLDNFADDTTYGIGILPYGNNQRNRPLVAIAYNEGYNFGALDLPVPRDVRIPLVWKAYIKAMSAGSTETSPLFNLLTAYSAGNAGKAPVLSILELEPQ